MDDEDYQAACYLAKALFDKHYASKPDYASGRVVWGLCDTTAGVLSQIDNMVAGLSQDAERYRRLRQWAIDSYMIRAGRLEELYSAIDAAMQD